MSFGLVQSFAEYTYPGATLCYEEAVTDTVDEVSTTLLTLLAPAASITDIVPLTAGLMSSSSGFLTVSTLNGEAV